jgi:tRNA(fMet)-specific endonuclease VapC
MAYLLDTNVFSDLVRHPAGRVAQRIAAVGDDQVAISIVVAAEVRFGLARSGSRRLVEQAEGILDRTNILPLEKPVDRRYAELRHALERIGKPIGANDLLIAAHALATNSTLVTDNMREFSRVPTLKVENWLR